MGEPTPELERRVADLARALAALERRVASLETGSTSAGSAAPPTSVAVAATPGGEAGAARVGAETPWVSLVGRTLIALGGAYLLRAIGDEGLLPGRTAAAAGLAYAAWWLLAADRAAARGARASGGFHGLTACLVGFPLILETAARFGTISVPAAAALLVGLHAAACVIAWRRVLTSLAWLATLSATGTAVGLLLATRHLLPPALALLACAVVVERISMRPEWGGLRWPLGLAADAVVLTMAGLVARPGGLPEGYAPVSFSASLATALALPLLYLGSVAVRTVVRVRPVSGFAMLQSLLGLLIGLGGAEWMLASRSVNAAVLHVASLLLGGAYYAVGFHWVDRRDGRGRNFYYFVTLALLLVFAGSRGLLGGARLAALWLTLALALEWLGWRFDRRTLRTHGVAVWLAGAVASGLLLASLDGLTGAVGSAWRDVGAAGLAVAIAGGGCYALLLRSSRSDASWLETLPRAVLAALLALVVCGIASRWLWLAWTGAGAPADDAGALATLRTAVLAAAAITSAAARRRWVIPELGWLVAPLLAAGGLKLLAEDLSQGRPATLFLSLALYGGALVLVARQGSGPQPRRE